jgi:hypothetical protein
LKKNRTQIDAQDIENMLVTSIICDYVVERKKAPKRCLSIPFKAFSKPKSTFW